jgi:hypothetical protein
MNVVAKFVGELLKPVGMFETVIGLLDGGKAGQVGDNTRRLKVLLKGPISRWNNDGLDKHPNSDVHGSARIPMDSPSTFLDQR